MKYNLYKTAKKTAKENNLTAAVSKYHAGDYLYYDLSLLDSLGLDPADLDALKADVMNYHAVSWYDQPLPTLCALDRFSGLYGQIKTAAHRVYRADGKRIMVIVEIIAAHIEKQSRKDVWSEYKTTAVYEGKTAGHIEEDYELAV